jgi:hypothetical protein
MAEARPVTTLVTTTSKAPTFNSDVDWDTFDSVEYCDHNYQEVRDDDRHIVHLIRDFFAGAGVTDGRGVDVGPGANLYPSLAMLPFCRSLDLREYSWRNVEWLKKQVQDFEPNWEKFWQIYAENPAYAAVTDPRTRLQEIATVRRASVFDLPEAEWDLGTMFFVACSLSTDMVEFTAATQRFLKSLVPGAPFAAAFMTGSDGYFVGDVWFPAVAVEIEDIEETLSRVTVDASVVNIPTHAPLRDGVGMALATGRTKG